VRPAKALLFREEGMHHSEFVGENEFLDYFDFGGKFVRKRFLVMVTTQHDRQYLV
jgi:hypothetical protein